MTAASMTPVSLASQPAARPPAPAVPAAAAVPVAGGRFTAGLIYDVFAVLDRWGYQRSGDDRALGRAVGALFRLAGVYEGSLPDCCAVCSRDSEVPL